MTSRAGDGAASTGARRSAAERTPLSALAAWGVVAAGYVGAIALVLRRLPFGVDLQDESYYLAFAYRFARGDLPVLDDRSMHQFGSLLMVLPVKAYLSIVGSTEGIVYFARLSYVIAQLAVIAVVIVALQRLLGWWWAALVCLPLVFYVPMGIFGVSYNSVSALAFLLASVWSLRAALPEGRPWMGLAAGFFAGVTSVAYPTMLVPAVTGLGMLMWILVKRHGRARALFPVAGFALVTVPVLAYVLWTGLGPVLDMLRLSSLTGTVGGGLQKAGYVIWRAARYLKTWPIPLGLAVAAVVLRRRPVFAAAAVALIPIAAFFGIPGVVLTNPMSWLSGFVASLGLMAVVLYLGIERSDLSKTAMLTIVVPAIVAALTVSYTSFLNIGVAGQGLVPALVVMMIFSVTLIRGEQPKPGPAPNLLEWRDSLALVMILSLGMVMGAVLNEGVTLDKQPAALTGVVKGGPWDGLHTTQGRRAYVNELRKILAPQISRDDRVFAHSWNPGIYLLVQARVASPTMLIWKDRAERNAIAEEMREGVPPDFVIQDRYYWFVDGPKDPMTHYVYDLSLKRMTGSKRFMVYERREPAATGGGAASW